MTNEDDRSRDRHRTADGAPESGERTAQEDDAEGRDSPTIPLARRTLLAALGLAGLGVTASGVAAAVGETVGGGQDNVATGGFSTVSGGFQNEATAFQATVSGGAGNVASGSTSTIGGGSNNDATTFFTTVGGGIGNEASGNRATVSGGENSEASGEGATVGGGVSNLADEPNATVPGGTNNIAGGANSFAAGTGAEVIHDGTFAWSDATSTTPRSTAPNQFLVQATGGVGIGINTTRTQLDVRRAVSDRPRPQNHVMLVENTSQQDQGDVLGLQMQSATPTGNQHFLTFLANDEVIGSVEGNNQGGVRFRSVSGDFAEFFPKEHPEASFEPGQVVGLESGQIVSDARDAEEALVVTDHAIVMGNQPDESEADDHVSVALLGQVPVTATGPVRAGDRLLAASDNRAKRAAKSEAAEDEPVVGRALESLDDERGSVRTLVSVDSGPPTDGALRALTESYAPRKRRSKN